MPLLIEGKDISTAWLNAKDNIIGQPGHMCNNLIVCIANPLLIDQPVHEQYIDFCKDFDLTEPDKLSSTIFPRKMFSIVGQDREKLYRKYPKLHKVLKGKWGSYFNQMINWSDGKTSCNQLEYIISKINERNKIHKAAYTIQIPYPTKHNGWPRGGPCLNNILIQLKKNPNTMSIMAIYRSHDFAIKAYGNYMGLGHFLEFLASQTNFAIGTLTCISSHAFVEGKHISGLRKIIVPGGLNDR